MSVEFGNAPASIGPGLDVFSIKLFSQRKTALSWPGRQEAQCFCD